MVQGILLESSKDFLTVNKDGINVVALGSTTSRPIVDADGILRVLHSLESMSFLKVDFDNHLNFASQNMSKREVQIKQEFFYGDIGQEDELTKF